ncbi:MAG TPA: prepilin-type N-terminal cleavage/methylation domain-containing protein [Xanthomonadales bacterium]|nr:prepilin-type N-terminal cleavage/methylation domain-containing protein [Xanthomonadales bacterium]
MKPHKGFTLVELLLAITLLSILLALAYGGLHAAIQATDRGQVILEESGRLRMAHQFVRKQLNQAIPLAFNQQEGEALDVETAEVFLGSAQSIRFVGPMPGYLGFGGPQVQQLTVAAGENGLELVLEHALVQGFEESLLTERDPILLIDRIAAASFSFQGRDEEGELLPWTSTWEDPALLPVAIALEIEFEEGAYTDWPLLVAAVRIDPSVVAGVSGDVTYQSAIKRLIDRREKMN